MKLIDTHAHLYSSEFSSDIDSVIQNAKDEGVKQILFPAIDSKNYSNMVNLEEKHPLMIKSMIGLHPCDVKEDFESELKFVRQKLKERKFIGIGEIGLDFYWDKTHYKEQILAFEEQITLAKDQQLPIAIHCRASMSETLKIVSEHKDDSLRGVFHCFSGDEEQALFITGKMDFFLGIGGVITFKNSNLSEVLKNIPLEKIVLETDAPYLSPVPFRGKRNESSYLKYIAHKLAEVYNCSIEKIANQTFENSVNLFNLKNL